MSLSKRECTGKTPFTVARLAVLKSWSAEQLALKSRLVLSDDSLKQKPRFVAGVDISFFHGNSTRAVASLIIVQVLPSGGIRTVYEGHDTHVRMTEPYIAGYLAFRELKPLLGLFEKLKRTHPEYWPDVAIVDGNGVLHQRKFGLASHLGVSLNIPTIGVAKKLLVVPKLGVYDSDREKVATWVRKAKPLDALPLGNVNVKPVAVAIKVGNTSDTVFISQGHRVSLKMALRVVRLVGCDRETCDVVRLADRKSRDLIRRIEWENRTPNSNR
jgi:endonuclease V